MLFNKDSEEFKNLCVIRKSRKKYDTAGDYEKAKKAYSTFTLLITACTNDLIKQIDEVIKEQGE